MPIRGKQQDQREVEDDVNSHHPFIARLTVSETWLTKFISQTQEESY